jgi:hypothetical protein
MKWKEVFVETEGSGRRVLWRKRGVIREFFGERGEWREGFVEGEGSGRRALWRERGVEEEFCGETGEWKEGLGFGSESVRSSQSLPKVQYPQREAMGYLVH